MSDKPDNKMSERQIIARIYSRHRWKLYGCIGRLHGAKHIGEGYIGSAEHEKAWRIFHAAIDAFVKANEDEIERLNESQKLGLAKRGDDE